MVASTERTLDGQTLDMQEDLSLQLQISNRLHL